MTEATEGILKKHITKNCKKIVKNEESLYKFYEELYQKLVTYELSDPNDVCNMTEDSAYKHIKQVIKDGHDLNCFLVTTAKETLNIDINKYQFLWMIRQFIEDYIKTGKNMAKIMYRALKSILEDMVNDIEIESIRAQRDAELKIAEIYSANDKQTLIDFLLAFKDLGTLFHDVTKYTTDEEKDKLSKLMAIFKYLSDNADRKFDIPDNYVDKG